MAYGIRAYAVHHSAASREDVIFKSITELALILKTEPTAAVVTSDAYRRGDLIREWSLLLHPKFRIRRWYGGTMAKVMCRIFLVGESVKGSPVYYDEILNRSGETPP